MRHEIIFSPEAVEDFKRISARDRSILLSDINKHLRYEPSSTSKSKIKRLKGISKPLYRLRVNEYRVYYDVVGQAVNILAIVSKRNASTWLNDLGEKQ